MDVKVKRFCKFAFFLVEEEKIEMEMKCKNFWKFEHFLYKPRIQSFQKSEQLSLKCKKPGKSRRKIRSQIFLPNKEKVPNFEKSLKNFEKSIEFWKKFVVLNFPSKFGKK